MYANLVGDFKIIDMNDEPQNVIRVAKKPTMKARQLDKSGNKVVTKHIEAVHVEGYIYEVVNYTKGEFSIYYLLGDTLYCLLNDCYFSNHDSRINKLKEWISLDLDFLKNRYLKNAESNDYFNQLELEQCKYLGIYDICYASRLNSAEVREQTEQAEAKELSIEAENDYLNKVEISPEDFIGLCNKYKIIIPIQTLGLLNSRKISSITQSVISRREKCSCNGIFNAIEKLNKTLGLSINEE